MSEVMHRQETGVQSCDELSLAITALELVANLVLNAL